MNQIDKKYEALFTPWKIGNVEIKNRIVMCPMGGTSLFGWFELTGCHFDKEAAKLFLERAKNNVGLIIPGIAPLRDTFWGKWLWQNPKMFEELKLFMMVYDERILEWFANLWDPEIGGFYYSNSARMIQVQDVEVIFALQGVQKPDHTCIGCALKVASCVKNHRAAEGIFYIVQNKADGFPNFMKFDITGCVVGGKLADKQIHFGGGVYFFQSGYVG